MDIFIDMDDVANQLCRFLVEQYNKDFRQSYDYINNTHFMIADNPDIVATNDYFTEILRRKGTFLDLEPTEGFVECIRRLSEEHDVRILTHPQWSSPYCASEKVQWLQKHLPFFSLRNLWMGERKGDLAGVGKILLDDAPHNLQAWHEAGGISVCYSVINYSRWNGICVTDFEMFDSVIQGIQSSK